MLREKDIKHFLAICLGLRVILTLLLPEVHWTGMKPKVIVEPTTQRVV